MTGELEALFEKYLPDLPPLEPAAGCPYQDIDGCCMNERAHPYTPECYPDTCKERVAAGQHALRLAHPTPWHANVAANNEYPDGGARVRDADGEIVAYVLGGTEARLLAAAPLLLAACERFVWKCENGFAKSTESYAQMKAAIAAVKGEA